MNWVYVSPHFDDVALSCGGLVWEQGQAGEQVSIWTICGGEAPPGELSPFAQNLHDRWEAGKNSPVQRRLEDVHSCKILGASYKHFAFLDCIYRRAPESDDYMYASEEALTGTLQAGDAPLVQDLRQEFRHVLPTISRLVCPLGLGKHVDHQLTRLAAEGLNGKVSYYADYPYVLRHGDQLSQMGAEGWTSHIHPISAEGLKAWQASIAAHTSQISTFWASKAAMKQAINEYWCNNGGIRLWDTLAR